MLSMSEVDVGIVSGGCSWRSGGEASLAKNAQRCSSISRLGMYKLGDRNSGRVETGS